MSIAVTSRPRCAKIALAQQVFDPMSRSRLPGRRASSRVFKVCSIETRCARQ
jgi:hypothetical protein